VTLRVLLCDDAPLVRMGFRYLLEGEPDIDVVGEAADGRQAVEGARRLAPDVVLMDIRMPVLDGIAATRELAGPDAASPVKVLILTTYDLDEYVVEALRAGASGFLLKDSPPDKLLEAVRVVAAGDALLAPRVTRRLLETTLRKAPRPAAPAALPPLTERERSLLTLVGRGQSNAEIAAELFLSEATVKTYVSRLLAKLGCRDRVQAVVLAYEAGLVRAGSA
jgi:DNA-binding NarL/FixJ family response regulator